MATMAFGLFQVPSMAIFFKSGTLKSRPEAECMITSLPFLTTLPNGLPRVVSR